MEVHENIEHAILYSDVRFRCVFRKCVLPEGLANEHSTNYLVAVKYYVGAPDLKIRQKKTDFFETNQMGLPGPGHE